MKETAVTSAFHKFYIHSDVKVLVLVYELMQQTKKNLLGKLRNMVRLETCMLGQRGYMCYSDIFALCWTQSQCPLCVYVRAIVTDRADHVMTLMALCPLHPQFAQWMDVQICFTLRFSLSGRFRCPRCAKTVTSSGESTPHKTSLKVGPAVKLKAFTHLAAHTADMIISHCVWAQFSIPFSLASQRSLLFHALAGRQARRHACTHARLFLHAVPAQ